MHSSSTFLHAATLSADYVQPWQISAFLRHGATGCSELYVPLVPPFDGYGAGMGAQQAEQLAHAAVRRYMQLAAQPRAELATTEAALRGHVQAMLMPGPG